jgi:hypothetical protein
MINLKPMEAVAALYSSEQPELSEEMVARLSHANPAKQALFGTCLSLSK